MVFEADLCRIPEASEMQTQGHMNDSWLSTSLRGIAGGDLSVLKGACQGFGVACWSIYLLKDQFTKITGGKVQIVWVPAPHCQQFSLGLFLQ